MRHLILALLLAGAATASTLEEQLQERKFEQALTVIVRALPRATGAERRRLLLLRADCEVQLQQLEAAQRTLAQVPVQKAPARFFRVRGQLNSSRMQPELARKDFLHVLTLRAEPAETVAAACALAELEERPERALEYWHRAVEASQQPGMPVSSWGVLYRERVNLLMKAGRLPEALSEARLAQAHFHALGRPGGERGMLLAEAIILKNLGRFEEAEAAWEKAIRRVTAESGGTLAVWGYNVLYGRTDPAALRRFLAASQKYWSEEWSAYERYHLRLLAGQIYLHALDEPRLALQSLQQAERLASRGPRPAGNFVTVNMRFHQLSTTPHSDLEQVLWLELRAIHKLRGDVVGFMEGKLRELPPAARSAWLFKLGEFQLGRAPELAAARFAEALQESTGADRARLLEAMLEAYLQAGHLLEARRTATAFGEAMRTVPEADRLDLTRRLTTLWQPWTQALWQGTLQPSGESPQLAVLEGLLEGRAQLDAVTRREREENLRVRDLVKLSSDYLSQARQLALENRLAEAQVACEKGREYAVEAHLLERQAQADRLLAYLLFRLGERPAALERIREARTTFAGLSTFDHEDEVAECAGLEAAFLLEQQQPDQALQLLRAQPQRPMLEFAQARALLELHRPYEALELLDRCEPQVEGTLYAVAVKTMRAVALRALERPGEAVQELAGAYSLARSLSSLKVRDLALLWHEWDAVGAPVAEAAATVEQVLAELPSGFGARVRERPATRVLLTLAGRAPAAPAVEAGWLSRAEFLREAAALVKRFPELTTTVPLLPATLAQKAEGLGREVLVEYYLGPRELVVLLAAQEGFAVKTLAVERTAIEERVARVRRQLTGGAEDAAAAAELARVLLDDRLEGRPVVVLAHGPLLGLPWDLLPGPTREWSLWAGEALTAYRTVAPQVLAVGNVTGVDLPGSAREVAAVSRLLPGQVLTGAQATASRLREGLPQADVVHLATHSTPTAVALSEGRLALQDVFSLPVKPGALVVLSSCEGASSGDQERGPVTLASAFLAAGASQVVAALTPVTDDEAEALFGEFYRALARGLTPGAALREAKQARRTASGRSDWAAFVLLGGI